MCIEEQVMRWKQRAVVGSVLLVVIALLAGCGGSSEVKPQAQTGQTQNQPAAASQNSEQAFKASCQELPMRGLNDSYTQFINKPVKADGPVTQIEKLNDNRVRVKVQYPDTDAVWVTTEKPLFKQPQVGKRVEFWGVLKGKGEKSKLPEVSATYFNVL